MTLTRKDLAAGFLTALALLVFAAAHESWNVWLIGSSNRWAAAAILLVGWLTCMLGSPSKDKASMGLAAIGVIALGAGVWAIWTASMTALSLLVVAIIVLWLGATMRHAWHPTHHRPIAT
jgi:hypothetical protein